MPGQFINSGNTPGGNLRFSNVNNQGNLTMAPYPPPTYTLGQAVAGGIVFYITGGGGSGTSGLISATADQSAGIQWYNGNFITIPGAVDQAVGSGLANTDAIIAAQGPTATNYAAGLARAYNGGGYSDWYLPSRDELTLLYDNQAYVGGFSNQNYWTSSQVLYYSAYARNMVTGGQINDQSDFALRVRAIRSF